MPSLHHIMACSSGPCPHTPTGTSSYASWEPWPFPWLCSSVPSSDVRDNPRVLSCNLCADLWTRGWGFRDTWDLSVPLEAPQLRGGNATKKNCYAVHAHTTRMGHAAFFPEATMTATGLAPCSDSLMSVSLHQTEATEPILPTALLPWPLPPTRA